MISQAFLGRCLPAASAFQKAQGDVSVELAMQYTDGYAETISRSCLRIDLGASAFWPSQFWIAACFS